MQNFSNNNVIYVLHYISLLYFALTFISSLSNLCALFSILYLYYTLHSLLPLFFCNYFTLYVLYFMCPYSALTISFFPFPLSFLFPFSLIFSVSGELLAELSTFLSN